MEELTIRQTNRILKKLKDYGFEIIDENNSSLGNIQIIDEDYFNEKVNEALEV